VSADSMWASNFMKLNVRKFSCSYTLSGGLPGICTQCVDTYLLTYSLHGAESFLRS